MSGRVRVGIVDSGCAPAQAAQVVASAAFMLDEAGVSRVAAAPDVLGHGCRVADVVLHCAPQAELLVAQVFRERLSTSAAQVAAAIDWLVAEDARIINLSLGLRAPRRTLEQACARAIAAGVVVCAAAPAIGQTVYPAGFSGVLKVTGDARCARMELAALGAAHADFGAHVRALGDSLSGAGASMACAHLSAHAARHFAQGGSADSLPAWLVSQAHYHGLEILRR